MASPGFGAGGAKQGGNEGRTDVRLEDVLRQLPSGVAVAEAPDGRLVHVNPQIERIWRRSLSGVRGVADYGAWQARHPDGRAMRPEEWPLARALSAGEVTDNQDVEIVRGDGSRAVVRVCASPIRDESGEVVAAVMVCSDVTLQRRREAVRRLLAETSAALAPSLDYERTLRNVARLVVPTLADWCSIDIVGEGRGIERLVVEHAGARRGESVHERSRSPGVPLESDPRIARVLRTGTPELLPQVDEELLVALASDERQLQLLREIGPCSAMIVPLVARERTLGAVVLASAESRRRYGPEDLELAKELAARAALAIDHARLYHESQAANRAKADFLAVISHELRTPLTAIIGYSELLALGVPEAVTERQKEQVERIEVAARHLLQLIEEILDMANLEQGRARIRRERVDVPELLRRARVIAQPLVAGKGLTLEVDPVEPDLVVESDPDKLLQVLLNLLSNAVKFTEEGVIRVSARSDGEGLEVRVCDTGMGVEPRDRERIFDPFWQAEQPITRRVGGTGLGLAISRRIMELLGGEVGLESGPGPGSTFVMRLPASPPQPST